MPLDREMFRRIAVEAVARGWLDAGGVWDTAARWQALGGAAGADAEAVFGGQLTPERIRTLVRAALRSSRHATAFTISPVSPRSCSLAASGN